MTRSLNSIASEYIEYIIMTNGYAHNLYLIIISIQRGTLNITPTVN